MPARPGARRNDHPRLRFARAAVRRAIAVLDARFSYLPGDLPHLTGPGFRRPPGRPLSRRDPIPGGCPPGELSIVFLTDPALAQLHADFMQDPTTTDVITFEGDLAAGLAGEICVSVDTARAYARSHRQVFSTELTLYLVHGWLHLAGYDDLRPARKRRMRAAEQRALALLRATRALPRFLLV